jgi:hypothetical protein
MPYGQGPYAGVSYAGTLSAPQVSAQVAVLAGVGTIATPALVFVPGLTVAPLAGEGLRARGQWTATATVALSARPGEGGVVAPGVTDALGALVLAWAGEGSLSGPTVLALASALVRPGEGGWVPAGVLADVSGLVSGLPGEAVVVAGVHYRLGTGTEPVILYAPPRLLAVVAQTGREFALVAASRDLALVAQADREFEVCAPARALALDGAERHLLVAVRSVPRELVTVGVGAEATVRAAPRPTEMGADDRVVEVAGRRQMAVAAGPRE